MRARRAALALLLSAASLRAADPEPTAAAQAFLAALRPELRAACQQPFDGDERVTWSYVPGRRRGVSLKQLNAAERKSAHALLRASLSERGYAKTEDVIALEGILREVEAFGFFRDPDLYYLTIFGAPSAASPWGWRFEGHHLSLNFSSVTGRVLSSSPAFFGANPARVPSGPRAGWRVLAAEEDLARQLLASLDERQRGAAVIAGSAPRDILFGPGRTTVPEPAGLPAGEMSAAQRAILSRLVGEYLSSMRPELARAQSAKIDAAGTERIRFAWAGGMRPGEGHYYRIQGPTFLIEYDNTQNGANHVHSVFRDLEDDFGGDLLRRHYAESPHHADAAAAR